MEQNLEQIAEKASTKGGVDIRDRKWRFNIEKTCFVGKDFVKWLKNTGNAVDEFEAERIG